MTQSSTSVYYCERCLLTYGKVVVMEEGTTADDDYQWQCPECGGEWRLNRGQARHIVSLQFQHYRKLAEMLGILEIEEEASP